MKEHWAMNEALTVTEMKQIEDVIGLPGVSADELAMWIGLTGTTLSNG
jgi:hypothetical protein